MGFAGKKRAKGRKLHSQPASSSAFFADFVNPIEEARERAEISLPLRRAPGATSDPTGTTSEEEVEKLHAVGGKANPRQAMASDLFEALPPRTSEAERRSST
ncbi:hypothetical protein KFK09_016826 [Dendrobium nobile]|uniref:Uncharacterized protein n=1 Tax=Dendrobium nobile TaxID=94219 RepID=A0A8T3B0L6_DENNO|nr:hypothetical protein KFK09_016826 [Dendrobium nobile]